MKLPSFHKTAFSASLAILTLSLGGLSTSQAALLAYEGFDQGTGSLSGTHGTGTWPTANQDWSFTSWSVTGGSLSYGTLQTAGNTATNASTGGSVRELGVSLGGDGSDIWISFLFNANGTDVGLSLFNGGSEINFIGTPFDGGGNYSMVNPEIELAAPIDSATHLFVVHFDQTANTTTLYLDPNVSSLGTGLAPTGGLSGSAAQSDFTFDRIRIGSFGGNATNAQFDEIRIGTTWQDVSPVPEPSAALSLLAGLAALTAARRRSCGDSR